MKNKQYVVQFNTTEMVLCFNWGTAASANGTFGAWCIRTILDHGNLAQSSLNSNRDSLYKSIHVLEHASMILHGDMHSVEANRF